MEYGTDEYFRTLLKISREIHKACEAGAHTEKGIRNDGTDWLFKIVQSLRPFGIVMNVTLEDIETGEDITEFIFDTTEDTCDYTTEKTFDDIFKELIDEGLIEDSEDGDKLPHEDKLGWFITPEGRKKIEDWLND